MVAQDAQILETDVVVVGAGCAGCIAAVAAARGGARVLLIERNGFLGGISTAVLDTFYAFYTPGQRPVKVVGGLPDLVVERLCAQDALIERPNTFGAGLGLTYSPEALKRVWDALMAEAGVRVLLHAVVDEVTMEGARPAEVVVATKAGRWRVRQRIVVDTSGDADIVALAGLPYTLAAREGPVQSLTTTFTLANVDVERALALKRADFVALMRAANESGDFHLPNEAGSVHRTPSEGLVFSLLVQLFDVDATDPWALSAAEAEGRRQVAAYVRFLQARVPGYERAVLVSTAPHIGVRETRRIQGDYVLTEDDVLAGRRFPDAIARCGAPIEDRGAGRDTRWVYLPEGESYDVPYRCLLPVGGDDVLVAGRCLSATHDAHASVRSMGTCMAMGQVAGTAAAMSVAAGVSPRALDTVSLRACLRETGAIC